jgi:hypothetical protein
MLRALVWIELCTTWWWWFAVLVPFAVTRQITIEDMLTPHLCLICLMPVMAGLGIASGMRDRDSIRAALSRYGTPWQNLVAKLVVPGVLMPLYYALGDSIAHQVSERAVTIGDDFRGWTLSESPAILAPIFLAGLATGLRQARWWATRLAPLIAIATVIALVDSVIPWTWGWERASTLAAALTAKTEEHVAFAIALSLLTLWWCRAALREAGGEDGPGSRLATASSVALAGLGLAMAPWLLINERWEGMLGQRHVDDDGAGHPAYAQPVHPGLSLIRLRDADATWSNIPVGQEWLSGNTGEGIGDLIYDLVAKTAALRKPNTSTGTDANVPVIVQGTDDQDGPTTLSAAWSRLGLAYGQLVLNRWRNISMDWTNGFSGRVVQAPGRRDPHTEPDYQDLHPWTYQDDPSLVRLPRDRAGEVPCRLFQVDSWSAPTLIIRPLTPADPPLLFISGDLRIGVWADRLNWKVGLRPDTVIPHPFTAPMPGHIRLRTDGDSDGKAIRVIYHWRPTPWSASRWRIDIVTHAGSLLSTTDLPTADSQLVVQALGLIGSPALAALGLQLNRDHELTDRPWAEPTVLPWCMAGGIIASAVTWFLIAKRGCSPRARLGWMVAALIGGVAVPLAALAVLFPVAQRPCPTCGRRRWADDTLCPVCGAAWGLPVGDDRDVHDRPHAVPPAAEPDRLSRPHATHGA